MKKTISACATALVLTAGLAQAEPVKIGIAAEPYPPFSTLNAAGEWVGWEIDIIDAICTAAELDCEIVSVAWDGIIPSLTSKQIDVIMASMSITEERLKTIDFSEPYYNIATVVVADKSMNIKATPASLAGKILGVQASTIHQSYAQKYFPDTEIRIYQTQDEANQDLFSGRIDATQADSLVMSEFVSGDSGACCEVKGNVADDPAILGLGAGAGIRKGETELKDALNKGIAKVLADGTHEKITIEHFGENVF